MIKITETEVFGFRAALRDMRNPMESWNKSDSLFDIENHGSWPGIYVPERTIIGSADMALAKKLISGGTEHRKFLRQIVINAVFEAPRYLWQEIDTYKVATVRDSCSTMHKLGHRSLTADDFIDGDVLPDTLHHLNHLGNVYREGGMKDYDIVRVMKRYLPEGYLQRAGYHMNYETALSMFRQRANHRLAEWRFHQGLPSSSICDWIYLLPYMSDFISALEKKGNVIMSEKTDHICEGCGAECDNPCATKGWIHISGTISRSHGVYGKSSYMEDYIGEPLPHDFCSLGCVEKALNKCKASQSNKT